MIVDAHCHYEQCEHNDVLPLYNSVKYPPTSNNNNTNTTAIFGYGVHPWYSYQYTIHPTTDPIKHYTKVIKRNKSTTDDEFISFIHNLPPPILLPPPSFSLNTLPQFIGEVGLDKTFRIIIHDHHHDTPSPHTTTLQHQREILEYWLSYASNNSLSVQLHAVKYHQHLLNSCIDTILSNQNCNILLHAYQGSSQSLSQWINVFSPNRIYLSFNQTLNIKYLHSYCNLIDHNHVLVETDSNELTHPQYDNLKHTIKIIQQHYNNTQIDFESNIRSFLSST